MKTRKITIPVRPFAPAEQDKPPRERRTLGVRFGGDPAEDGGGDGTDEPR